jgi:hypothetical protein
MAYAGPCSDKIVQMQSRVDAAVEQTAAAGATGREGTSRTHVQPTPRSIAEAEAKLGEVPAQQFDAVREAMVRARAADSAGDKDACEQALVDAQHALKP